MIPRLWPWLLIAAVGAAILFPMAGSFGLWDPLEPLYARSAVEMTERGSWMMPYFLGKVRLAKPILAYWAILAGRAVFGADELGGRMPGMLLAIVGMLATFHVARRLRGLRAGLLSALVLGTLPQYYLLARQATPDIYLAVTAGLALAFFGLGVYGGEEGRRSSFVVAAVALALAVLAKGPFIVATLGLGTLAIHLVLHLNEARPTRDALWQSIRPIADVARRHLPLCAGLAFAIAGPWFIWAAISETRIFFDDLLYFNNVHRFTHEIENSGNATYYLRTLLFGAYPWSIFLPAAFALAVPWREPRLLERHGADVLWLVSLFVTFGVFTASVTKFPHYVAPALIPLALVVGGTLDRLLEAPTAPSTRIAQLVAAMMLLPPSFDLLREQGLEYFLEGFTTNDSLSSAVTAGPFFESLIAALLLLLLAGVVFGARPLAWGFVACAIGFALWANWSFIPGVSPAKTVEPVCAAWLARTGADDELGVFDVDAPGVHYYTAGKTRLLGSHTTVFEFLSPGSPKYAIVPEDKLSSLTQGYARRFPGNKLYLVDDSHRDYVLITSLRPLLTPGSGGR